jgi:hypothetical protein
MTAEHPLLPQLAFCQETVGLTNKELAVVHVMNFESILSQFTGYSLTVVSASSVLTVISYNRC